MNNLDIKNLINSDGYKQLREFVFSRICNQDPNMTIEDIAKQAMIDVGMKEPFLIAESFIKDEEQKNLLNDSIDDISLNQ